MAASRGPTEISTNCSEDSVSLHITLLVSWRKLQKRLWKNVSDAACLKGKLCVRSSRVTLFGLPFVPLIVGGKEKDTFLQHRKSLPMVSNATFSHKRR